MGRSWSARSSFTRFPVRPGLGALQAQAIGRRRNASVASSGVVTVINTTDPAACRARTTSAAGTPKVKLTAAGGAARTVSTLAA